MTAEIIAFPLQHRVVPTEETLVVMPLKLSQKDEQASIIDHDGRPYKLADLIRHLSPAELRQVGETGVRHRTGRIARFSVQAFDLTQNSWNAFRHRYEIQRSSQLN